MNGPHSLRSFRRRLAIVCVAIAGLSAGFLALTSYFAMREYRFRAFEDQATRKVELASLLLPEQVDPARVEDTLASYQLRGGFETIAVARGTVYSSAPTLALDAVPEGLREGLGNDEHRARTTHADTRYLVVGRLSEDRQTELYFFFSLEDVHDSITQFRNVLLASWLVTVGLAAFVGAAVARRVLRPVRHAANAARALGTRLLGDDAPPGPDDEFGLWVQSFNDVATALEAKIEELSEAAARERRFTSDVAHELRTPLTALVSAAALLDDQLDELPTEARRAAELLIKDVRRLRTLVVELLELARLDAGGEPIQLEAVTVGRAVVAALQPWAGQVAVHFDVDVDTVVVTDRARFKRVMANLVDNAIHHGGGDVSVIVGASSPARVVNIDVVDRGPGIRPTDADRVFDRFYKSDDGRASHGSGLGLAIAREHERAIGATLELLNPGERGARFRFSVPCGDTSRVTRRPALA